MITPATYTEDAINQLNQQGIDVVKPVVLYQQRNLARRQYCGEYPWRWLTRHVALTFVLDVPTGLYTAILPSDVDFRFPSIPSSLWNGRTRFWSPVSYPDLFLAYSGESPRFYLDQYASRVLSGTAGTAILEYQAQIADLPTNTTLDGTPDPIPNANALTFLLASYYVLATRQELGTAQYFGDKYDAQVQDDVSKANAQVEVRSVSMPVTGRA